MTILPFARRLAAGFALAAGFGHAQAQSAEPVDTVRFDSMGDYGNVGLLQMPSARMADDGQLTLGFSYVWPHERYTITMQALPWLETTLRYTNILNRAYGPVEFSGDQTGKDRSFDIKLRLIEESRWLPQIAIGLRDIAGTGNFSSEYLVANRRYGNWDFMLGLGWGQLGTRGQLRNPLRSLSSGFATRIKTVGEGGTIDMGSLFHGERTSLLFGVSYLTGIEGLTLKAELDGNDYQHEANNNNQPVRSPINLGANYRLNPWVDLSIALERGNRAMFQVVFKENLKSSGGFPKYDPPPEKIVPRPPAVHPSAALRAQISDSPAPTPASAAQRHTPSLQGVVSRLASAGFVVDSLELDAAGRRLTVWLSQHSWRNHAQAAGRAGRIIANSAPSDVEEIVIANLESGVESHRLTLWRRDLEQADTGSVAAEDLWRKAGNTAPQTHDTNTTEVRHKNPERYPTFHWQWAPGLRQHIGGPDNPYFYQIYLNIGGEVQIARGLSLSAAVGLNVYNNFAALKLPSDSKLPHVRSDIKDYLKQGKNNIARLQADYVLQASPNLYLKASAGLLEEMFAGAGVEALYRPYGERWALGGNLYKVRQRDYDQLFALRTYETATGHVDLHYRLPFYNIQASLSVGQYLAGDRGATLELSRQFGSGARVGIWATRTNVSAEQFGEGSFDKGIFITFPLDRISLFSSRSMLNFAWRPLTRDGGQKLVTGKPLNSLLHATDANALLAQWPSVLR